MRLILLFLTGFWRNQQLPVWRRYKMHTFLIAASNAGDALKDRADFVCDGTDDQKTISAAIGLLPDCGGVVALSEGTFHTSEESLTISRPNVSLVGFGPNVTKLLIGSGIQFGVVFEADWSKLAGMHLLSVDGDNGSHKAGTHLVEVYRSSSPVSNVWFEDLVLEHARNGLRWNGSRNIMVRNVHCRNLGNQGMGTMGGGGGRSENISIDNVSFENVWGTGVTLNPVKRATVSNVRIIGGESQGGWIDVSSCVHNTQDVTINNVVAEGTGLLEAASNLEGATVHPSGIAVNNCVVRNVKRHPVIQGKFDGLSVSNLTVNGAQHRPINILRADNLQMANVTINAADWSDPLPNMAVFNLEDTPGAQLVNVSVIGSANENSPTLYIGGDGVRFIGGEVSGSCKDGILVNGSGFVIEGCVIRANERSGIRANADGGKISACTFKENSGWADISIPGVGAWQVIGNRFESIDVNRHYDDASSSGAACIISNNVYAGGPAIEAARIRKAGSIDSNNLDLTT
jgi:hypothetical protein